MAFGLHVASPATQFKSNEDNLDHEGKRNESVYNDMTFDHLYKCFNVKFCRVNSFSH